MTTTFTRALNAVRRALSPYDEARYGAAVEDVKRAWGEMHSLKETAPRRIPTCLREIAGGRCGRRRDHDSCDGCSYPFLDHVTLWKRTGDHRPTVLVAQPYQVDDVEEVVEAARHHGLVVTFHDEQSWHYPGNTLLLMFEAYRDD